MNKKVITFGEIMLRLSTPGNLRFSQATEFTATYGGGEANVAVSLANYNVPVDFVTRIPDNDIGRACKMDLKKYGVGTDKIITGGERLGIYFLETGAVSRGSKVIYDRAHSSISEIKNGKTTILRLMKTGHRLSTNILKLIFATSSFQKKCWAPKLPANITWLFIYGW